MGKSFTFFITFATLLAMMVCDSIEAREYRGRPIVNEMEQVNEMETMTTEQVMEKVDSALEQCPAMCNSARDSLWAHLPKNYVACMDDCVCAAYCYVMEKIDKVSYSQCVVPCVQTKPFSGQDPKLFMDFIDQN